ncbi:MAG: FHA domain-containing protein [Synergistaceae bacterium]|nr:FHA domain-containing protein [Synergistaceae bacterium]
MELVKLCPACGEANPVSEVVCRVCMTNLSSVPPLPAGRTENPPDPDEPSLDAEAKTAPSPSVLTFKRVSDGRAIPVASGDAIGRLGEMLETFEAYRTVSRVHARVALTDDAWAIEDLGSTNGTWVNGRRIEPGRPCPIKKGDTVSLSIACEMIVL